MAVVCPGMGQICREVNRGQVRPGTEMSRDDLTSCPGRYRPSLTGKVGPFGSPDTAQTREDRGKQVHFLASTFPVNAAAE